MRSLEGNRPLCCFVNKQVRKQLLWDTTGLLGIGDWIESAYDRWGHEEASRYSRDRCNFLRIMFAGCRFASVSKQRPNTASQRGGSTRQCEPMPHGRLLIVPSRLHRNP